MSDDHKPLSDQVIVVFGATSGIGRVTAQLAASRGARVVASGRDEGTRRNQGTPGRVPR